MDRETVNEHKRKIDEMSQEDMARLWRFAPGGHIYFLIGTELSEYYNEKFEGMTPELSKKIGLSQDEDSY